MRRTHILIPLFALILTCSVSLAHSADETPTQLDRPLRTTLRIEGRSTPLRGEITAWTFGAFWVLREGGETPVRTGWDALDAGKVFEMMRRLLDRDDAEGYLRLGIEMLRLGDERSAERALSTASRIDPALAAVGARANELWRAGEDPGGALASLPERAGEGAGPAEPNGTDPQGPPPEDDTQAEHGVEPWAILGPEDRQRAVELQRRFAETAGLEPGDNRRRINETAHFIMATDLDERSMKHWGEQLEVMYSTMCTTLSLPRDTELYAGKCMVFVYGSRDAYIKFERVAMGYNAERTGGICHYRGADVILAFYRRGSDADFQSVLVHESVHGIIYRYRTPARLPTWANEGLADYISGRLTPDSIEPREHWNHVKAFVLRRQDPMTVMRQSYVDGTWFNEDSYPVSHMLVRFLIRYKPAEFKLWIDDIKAGADWEGAMKTRFGVDAATLARGFCDEIVSEKRYTPAP